MANEAKKVRASTGQKTISTTIAAISSGAITSAITGYTATDTLDYPDAEFVLAITYATAPTENSTIDLYVRAKNIQSTNHQEAFDSTYKPGFVCSFPLNNVTTKQYIFAKGFDLPKEGDFYLFANGTTNTSNGSIELYMTPCTLGPA